MDKMTVLYVHVGLVLIIYYIIGFLYAKIMLMTSEIERKEYLSGQYGVVVMTIVIWPVVILLDILSVLIDIFGMLPNPIKIILKLIDRFFRWGIEDLDQSSERD